MSDPQAQPSCGRVGPKLHCFVEGCFGVFPALAVQVGEAEAEIDGVAVVGRRFEPEQVQEDFFALEEFLRKEAYFCLLKQ